ncbi:MAG: hypothetical protein M0Z26_01665 [Acidithiobacillus sp.]|nr:hypothetical protein [Acidithiobacillus sp.]
MSTVSTFNLPDLDQRVAALRWYIDAARAIAPDDPIHLLMATTAINLQAAADRVACRRHPTPDFRHSQMEAAKIVASALGLEPCTFRANKPWLLLQQKGLGEGIGFRTLGVRSRRYTQEAVDYLIAHWDLTRMAMR